MEKRGEQMCMKEAEMKKRERGMNLMCGGRCGKENRLVERE